MGELVLVGKRAGTSDSEGKCTRLLGLWHNYLLDIYTTHLYSAVACLLLSVEQSLAFTLQMASDMQRWHQKLF